MRTEVHPAPRIPRELNHRFPPECVDPSLALLNVIHLGYPAYMGWFEKVDDLVWSTADIVWVLVALAMVVTFVLSIVYVTFMSV